MRSRTPAGALAQESGPAVADLALVVVPSAVKALDPAAGEFAEAAAQAVERSTGGNIEGAAAVTSAAARSVTDSARRLRSRLRRR